MPLTRKYRYVRCTYQWVDRRQEGLSICVFYIDRNHIRFLILQLKLADDEVKKEKNNNTLNKINRF